ncbi:SPG1, ras family GTPase [Selaginella moellendorffii]|uniref:SPG1, ras family GTPase n=1 Tax=Selaginella moellendorffii TaxID=88036 RepID=D8R2A7_SELML|nr:septum-promoting GTP-binding protein 1 [Selaginella moellendorffii]EFJ33691.1 SPG1, ras family GTPase [Selaginella moellendorffii]|eukprot:XP_002964853.1 septum-promoting GTP-binding protein 1 [Selaginella moellendorffii]
MNISLLDDRSQVVCGRILSRPRSSSRRWPQSRFYVSADCIGREFKRGIVWIGRAVWKKSKLSITACWSPRSFSNSSSSSSSIPYHRLEIFPHATAHAPKPSQPSDDVHESCGLKVAYGEDTVVVKVGIVGDCQTGKTSLMQNYVVGDRSNGDESIFGVNAMDKVLDIHVAKIALSIWELGGYKKSMVPAVCNDAAAILILFDLTRRTTLHSVKQWFMLARQCNQGAIPVLVGTKFDQFIKMPEGLKSLITKQARLYAQAMGAPLLFTSTPYNINVHKVFKIVLARIFDLPCNISRNLTPGEPLVVY